MIIPCTCGFTSSFCCRYVGLHDFNIWLYHAFMNIHTKLCYLFFIQIFIIFGLMWRTCSVWGLTQPILDIKQFLHRRCIELNMVTNCTLKDYVSPNNTEPSSTIVHPTVNVNNFKLYQSLLSMVQQNQYMVHRQMIWMCFSPFLLRIRSLWRWMDKT